VRDRDECIPNSSLAAARLASNSDLGAASGRPAARCRRHGRTSRYRNGKANSGSSHDRTSSRAAAVSLDGASGVVILGPGPYYANSSICSAQNRPWFSTTGPSISAGVCMTFRIALSTCGAASSPRHHEGYARHVRRQESLRRVRQHRRRVDDDRSRRVPCDRS